MSLTEKRIAELILLYISCQITDEEKRELMEGYVNLSVANRLHFEQITNRDYLRNRLQAFYKPGEKDGPPTHS